MNFGKSAVARFRSPTGDGSGSFETVVSSPFLWKVRNRRRFPKLSRRVMEAARVFTPNQPVRTFVDVERPEVATVVEPAGFETLKSIVGRSGDLALDNPVPGGTGDNGSLPRRLGSALW